MLTHGRVRLFGCRAEQQRSRSPESQAPSSASSGRSLAVSGARAPFVNVVRRVRGDAIVSEPATIHAESARRRPAAR